MKQEIYKPTKQYTSRGGRFEFTVSNFKENALQFHDARVILPRTCSPAKGVNLLHFQGTARGFMHLKLNMPRTIT
jgi:hypothetical protein